MASGIILCAAIYYVKNRNEKNEEGIDELSTGTLAVQEPIRYYHLKYFGDIDDKSNKASSK